MMTNLQVVLCCALLLLVTVGARPQVWNIGFAPNNQLNGSRAPPARPDGRQNPFLPQIDGTGTSSSTTTAAPAVQVTTPSRAYYDCLGRCPSTSEYNPICGTDRVSYHNLGRLECAARCGTNVAMVRAGACST